MSGKSVKIQIYYFFSVLMGLWCAALCYMNYCEIRNFQNNNPDLYVFLPKKEGLIFAVTSGIVFLILLVILSFGFIKRKNRIVFRTALIMFLFWGLSVFLYHLVSGFTEFGQ